MYFGGERVIKDRGNHNERFFNGVEKTKYKQDNEISIFELNGNTGHDKEQDRAARSE